MSNLKIIIYKSEKRLEIQKGSEVILDLPIGLGASTGHKEVEGDHKTPEGNYEILVKNPKSGHYLSLGLSYPNKKDAKAGYEKGSITSLEYQEICSRLEKGQGTLWNTKLGGKIYIHGGLETTDGSQGCICLYKNDIEKVYTVAEVGTQVSILP